MKCFKDVPFNIRGKTGTIRISWTPTKEQLKKLKIKNEKKI